MQHKKQNVIGIVVVVEIDHVRVVATGIGIKA